MPKKRTLWAEKRSIESCHGETSSMTQIINLRHSYFSPTMHIMVFFWLERAV